MHDTTLQVIDIRALPVTQADANVTLAMLVGLQTPFAGPDGQPVVLPSGIYKVPLGKAAAQELVKSLSEELEKLPEEKPQSNIVVPGSMDDVDRVAQDLNRFKS